MNQFRKLYASDIEVRPQSVKNGKVTMLLYKDARCDMKILDETVGPMRWQRSHNFKEGICYCTVSIYDDDLKTWVSKEDCGTESNQEATKGQSSDAFKRACFCWGIGRELYSAPRIQIDDDGYGNNGCSVKEIGYSEEGAINHLVIENRFGKEVFNLNNNTIVAPKSLPKGEVLKGFCTKKKNEEGTNLVQLAKFYKYYEPRVEDWKGNLSLDTLWDKWCA